MADKQATLGMTGKKQKTAAVECLGMNFESDAARRAHFTEVLRQKLADPAFRATPGFPKATDEAILRMSDPPYYTACPNPFLGDFVRLHGKPLEADDSYQRDPFSVDVRVGKTDQLYKAHSYHTKVPHLAIVPSILHYTNPGDIVLDGFCGSGMTGLAALWCGAAPREYRQDLEAEWKRTGYPAPTWGPRRSILNDLGPAASFIAAGYNTPFDVDRFEAEANAILAAVDMEFGWMYETTHTDGRTKGRINYTVWSEAFTCPECAGEIVFFHEAMDDDTKRVADEFACPHCSALVGKRSNLERAFDTIIDPATGRAHKRVKLRPALINYSVGKKTFEKAPGTDDVALLDRIAGLPLPNEVPTVAFPIDEMYHGSRLAPKGFTHVHHLFLPRAAQALAFMWRRANAQPDPRIRSSLIFMFEQALRGMSLLNRYKPIQFGRPGGSQVGLDMPGVYYVSSLSTEVGPHYQFGNKLSRLAKVFRQDIARSRSVFVGTGHCGGLVALPDESVDYVFTDPPFGENIYYSDLNFLVEAWHGVMTSPASEAIVDRPKGKGLHEYQNIMRDCFREYGRVLKPGRWMTVVFSNSSNAVWRAIQEALGTAGFVVADVRTLDKEQGSYRQVTSSAVKQDLVISAYKPSEALSQRFELGTGTPDDAWAFVREHLKRVPVFADKDGDLEVVLERTAQTLHDRMIAFFVQRGVSVPFSGPEFFEGLDQRVSRRDGMYFLPDQATRYDKKRALGGNLRQLSLFVLDEASAIRWLRQSLDHKPQSFQDLQPQFMKAAGSWAKHERTVELKDLLRENFLHYDGMGEVPAPVHSYLSSNLKLRNLDKSHPELREAGRDRWYVPSVHRQGDLEQLRIRALLREFEEYKQSTQRKIKQFRTEAVRAGFKAAYDARDYRTIVEVAAKLPDEVVQEDEKLLMYLDVAMMRYDAEQPSTLFADR